jgi:uncharacterized protein YciI
MTFIYTLHLIPRLQGETAVWTEEDERLVTAHFLRLKRDHEQGIVRFAGRTEATDAKGFGVVLFDATDLATALEYTAADPAVAGGVMTASCQPFRIAIGSGQ